MKISEPNNMNNNLISKKRKFPAILFHFANSGSLEQNPS
jgi:hypothetical protein